MDTDHNNNLNKSIREQPLNSADPQTEAGHTLTLSSLKILSMVYLHAYKI